MKIEMDSLDKGLLDLFWKLAEGNDKERGVASEKLTDILIRKQKEDKSPCKDLKYAVNRLIRGLASDRKFARHGYSIALTKLLNQFQCVTIAELFNIINNELKIQKGCAKSEASNMFLGQVMAYLTIVQCDKIHEAEASDVSHIAETLNKIKYEKVLLSQICTSGLVQLITKVSKKIVKKSVWPSLEKELCCGWSKCQPDTLLLLMTFVDHHPDLVGKEFLQKHWDSKKLFSKKTFEKIGIVMSKSTSINPLIHPVCDKILEKAAQKPETFLLFCQKIINECLLHQAMPKKFLCLHLIHDALAHVTTVEEVKTLLSENLVGLLMKQLQDKEQHVHGQCKKLVGRFVTVVKEMSDPEVQVTMVLRLLQPPGSVFFDNVTKSSTVSAMIRNLNCEASKTFASMLTDMVLGGNRIGHKETIEFEVTLKWVIPMLANMVTQVSKADDEDWQLNLLQFLFLHGYFKINKENPNISHCDRLLSKEISVPILTLMQENFFRALDRLTSFSPGPGQKRNYQKHSTSVLNKLVLYVQDLLSAESVTAHTEFSASLLKHWKKVHTIVKDLTALNSQNASKGQAFELLFVHLAFQLFTDPKAVGRALEDLYICYSKAFKSKKKRKSEAMDTDDGEEPEWIEVVTEILLSLLSQPSHLLRTVVKNVFSMLCPHLTSAALQIIVEVLKSHGNEAEDVVDFQDDEDETEEGVEGDEQEGSKGTPKMNTAESDESDSDSDSDSDKEGDAVNELVKKSLKAALGPAALGSDNDEDSGDDLSDSEMEKLDANLASAFKSFQKSSKKANLGKWLQLKQYKMRCLDLIEVLTQGETQAGFLLELLYPLIDLLEDTQNEKDVKELYNRALNVYHGLVKGSKSRKMMNLEGVERDALPELAQDLIHRSTKVTGRNMIVEVANALVFVINMVISLDSNADHVETGSVSSPSSSDIVNHNSSHETLATIQNSECLKSVLNIIRKSIQDYCQKRDSLLSDVLFSVMFERLSLIMWPLIPDLIALAQDTDIRIFCRTKVCSLVKLLLNKNTVRLVGEEKWRENSQTFFTKFTHILDATLNSENVKPKFLQEVLQVQHNIIQLSSDDVVKMLGVEPLLEKVATAKGKNKSKDLKVICNRTQQLVFRRLKSFREPGQQMQRKKTKRKAADTALDSSSNSHSKIKKKKLEQEEKANNVSRGLDTQLLTETVVNNMKVSKEALKAKKLLNQKKYERLTEQRLETLKLKKKKKHKSKRQNKTEGESTVENGSPVGGMVGVSGNKAKKQGKKAKKTLSSNGDSSKQNEDKKSKTNNVVKKAKKKKHTNTEEQMVS